VLGVRYDDTPFTVEDLGVTGAIVALLKDAIHPNLVQTTEHHPVIVHGGPFANIAHGCNSVIATKLEISKADYAITEAGFGGDLGAEKFFDIKCRQAGLKPSAVVLVATIRALKMHGGLQKNELGEENIDALKKGMPNLLRHLKNVKEVYKLPCVVAINRFPTDTQNEVNAIIDECKKLGVNVKLSNVWAEGGKGGVELAEEVIRLCEMENDFSFSYELEDSLEDKIEKIVTRVYGGDGVIFTDTAKENLKWLKQNGFDKLPVCMAKTQYSFSDDKSKLGAPTGFKVTVRALKVSAGAGFVVAYSGNILTMPGLPKKPAAEVIDVTPNGEIVGLF
jgi:formate--tetrahydrofolate ligase